MNPDFQKLDGTPVTHDEVEEEMQDAREQELARKHQEHIDACTKQLKEELSKKAELMAHRGPEKSTDPPIDLPMHDFLPEDIPEIDPPQPPKPEPKRADKRTINRKRKNDRRLRTCACCLRRLPLSYYESKKGEFCATCRE